MVTVSPHVSGSVPSAEYDKELCALVLDTAPRVFAVVQEHDAGSPDADGWVAAWGMAYDDGRVHVVSADGDLRMSLRAPERALRWFGRREGVTARLVWLDRACGATVAGEAA